MTKANAYITENSFGSMIPENWEAVAALLNEKIDALEENEFGEIDQDEVAAIWENYCHGDYDGEVCPVTVRKYELRTKDIEIANRDEAVEGCAFDTVDESTVIATFETEDEALEALNEYESTVTNSGSMHKPFLVREYWVEENSYTVYADGSVADCTFLGTCGFADGLPKRGI